MRTCDLWTCVLSAESNNRTFKKKIQDVKAENSLNEATLASEESAAHMFLYELM